ncbi:unnamed protein product [Adineta steineri]|uniref:Exonuclease domain-containing protein n=1 Tax=Adineta steineri TaxID=433720 RepID=A0A814FTL8_9BILA|nr:unnamed protein product [Adineta steineri]CAF0986610.1 unnamed protein product [Adineta steineri]CAF3905759.1 unnamed protein product [Adineta steineri]CAF4106297.1 unnamed protein product [Adineta steineri]
MDSTLENSSVEVKTNKLDALEKDQQVVEDLNDVIPPVQNSEKSQNNIFNSNQSIQVLSIDVECVATGFSHLDRAPCSVAIVNDRCEILFDSLIKPDKPVVSDLFPFTGVRKTDLHHAPSFDEVIKKVHSFFTPTTLIVGQSIMSDVNWMKLQEGVHYSTLIDLGDEFRTFDPKYGSNKYFSLAHEAEVLLKIDLNATGSHIARDDAKASIKLYNKYVKDKDQSKLQQACQALLRAPTKIPLFRRFSGAYEKVCVSAFNRGYCRCGQPLHQFNYGIVGLYNFYRTQIIKHKSKNNLYFLFTRWGRIGDAEGQYQLTPYSTLDECRKEFLKVFREKTAVPIDFQSLQTEHVSSKLHLSIFKDFLKTLINRQAIRSNIDKTQLDIEWMPVSQLKRETLQKTRDLLIELKNSIEKKQELTLAIQRGKTIEQQNQFKTILDSIYKHTNEYYTIIPLRCYADEKLPIIDNERQLKQQEKILLGAQANLKTILPLDYLYKSINCQFEAMNKDDID